MIPPQTIQELTGNMYSELMYYQDEELSISGSFIAQIIELLSKCDIYAIPTNTYDLDLEQAVRAFQYKIGINQTGVLDNSTWQSMILYSYKYSDSVKDEGIQEAIDNGDISNSPHFNSYFNNYNMKPHRRNYKDIKIIFGNNTIVKTIKNVIMRSVSVEVDTSGNPISETYEFIAQDVIETDEPMDIDKYTSPEDSSSIDVKYKFPYFKNS